LRRFGVYARNKILNQKPNNITEDGPDEISFKQQDLSPHKRLAFA